MRNNSGSLLPGIIAPLFLASALVILSYILIAKTMLLESFDLRSEAEREERVSNLKSALSFSPALEAEKLECYEGSLCLVSSRKFQPISGAAEIIGSALADLGAFPEIDFEMLLAGGAPCSPSIHSGSTSPRGKLLTPNSSIWPETCFIDSAADKIAHAANVTAQANLNFSASSEPAIIAAAGFVDIQGLYSERDIIVVAAGDIFIGNITAPSPIRLTLISTGGIINIEGISGTFYGKVISRGGHFLPMTISAQSPPLLPPLLETRLLSLNLAAR